jgi:hypothetical protein
MLEGVDLFFVVISRFRTRSRGRLSYVYAPAGGLPLARPPGSLLGALDADILLY